MKNVNKILLTLAIAFILPSVASAKGVIDHRFKSSNSSQSIFLKRYIYGLNPFFTNTISNQKIFRDNYFRNKSFRNRRFRRNFRNRRFRRNFNRRNYYRNRAY